MASEMRLEHCRMDKLGRRCSRSYGFKRWFTSKHRFPAQTHLILSETTVISVDQMQINFGGARFYACAEEPDPDTPELRNESVL